MRPTALPTTASRSSPQPHATVKMADDWEQGLRQQNERQRSFAFAERLSFPDPVEYFHLGDVTVVVAPLLARWCVFKHPEQVQVFQLLHSGSSIGEVLTQLRFRMGDQLAHATMQHTLVEIDDKEFYCNANATDRDTYACLKLNVTDGCNLRCRHCYRRSGVPFAHELETTELVRLVEEHAALNGTSIMVSGGEPLFRRSTTISLLRRAKELGLKTVMLTNGTMITARTAQLLEGLLDQVQISLDGPDPITNDSVRGYRTFERINKAIEHFRHATVRLIIAMTPLPETIKAFEEKLGILAARLSNDFGDRCVIQLGGIVFDGRDVKGLEGPFAQSWLERVKALQNGITNAWTSKQDAASFEPGVRVTGCGYGEGVTVEPDGRVHACRLAREPVVADIRNRSLNEVRARLRSMAEQVAVDRSSVCSRCSLRYLCGGPCRFEPVVGGERESTTRSASPSAPGYAPYLPSCDGSLKTQLCKRLAELNSFRYQQLD